MLDKFPQRITVNEFTYINILRLRLYTESKHLLFLTQAFFSCIILCFTRKVMKEMQGSRFNPIAFLIIFTVFLR